MLLWGITPEMTGRRSDILLSIVMPRLRRCKISPSRVTLGWSGVKSPLHFTRKVSICMHHQFGALTKFETFIRSSNVYVMYMTLATGPDS